MKKRLITFTVFLLAAAAVFSAISISGAAANSGDKRIVIVADAGAHCSIDAINDAVDAGADMVRLSVEKDKNGRLTVNADGLTFREALDALASRAAVMADFDFSIRDEVLAATDELGMTDYCLFVLRAGAKQAIEWTDEKDIDFLVYKKTNIIFSALSLEKALAGKGGVWLASANPYGVVFGRTVSDRFADLTGAAVCLTDKKLSGKRYDTPDYWENVVSAGYNILITDDAAGAAEYREQSEKAHEKLREYLAEVESSFTLPEFKSAKFRDMKLAYRNAMKEAKRLEEKSFAGKNECENAVYVLKAAINDINANYDALASGEADYSVTPGKLLTAVLTVGLFTALEVFIAKKRKKKSNI